MGVIGLGIQGLGFWISGTALGLRVMGLGFGVKGSRFRG
jgi:hypothetical protein